MIELSNRQRWTDKDFRTVFAFITDIRAVLKECPERAAEFASVLLDDCDRAANAMTYIMRGCGATL